ncbi:MAG TPA: hypothetical protein VIP79_01890 [Gemmatimonadaceae bacterium]|jgi:hypothetical protein
MIEHIHELRRAWRVPLLVRHQSLTLLSQSFLGATTVGVNFDLLLMPKSSTCFRHPDIPPCR